MVLLTSSAVSVAISAGTVCIFTFLLFLSGYVLQQQTVRSLQEALRNPPEKPWFPTPVLPPQFREGNEDGATTGVENETIHVSNDKGARAKESLQGVGEKAQSPVALNSGLQEQTPLQLWRDYVQKQQATIPKPLSGLHPLEELTTDDEVQNDGEDQTISFPNLSRRERLAYIFTAPSPSDLCSIAVFVKEYRSETKLGKHQPNLVLIYPATWEISDTASHIEAMDLIREMQEKSDITCHPVSISRVWAGIGIESQLLAELQRTRWAYDRAMYLKSPGMVLDVQKLDRALVSSLSPSSKKSGPKQSLPKSWTTLSSKTTTLQPDLLLYVQEKGLLAPMGEMKQFAVEVGGDAETGTDHDSQLDVSARSATWVIFDEDDLRQRRRHKSSYAGTIFERFERERRAACFGTTLLKKMPKSEEKIDSRRTAR